MLDQRLPGVGMRATSEPRDHALSDVPIAPNRSTPV